MVLSFFTILSLLLFCFEDASEGQTQRSPDTRDYVFVYNGLLTRLPNYVENSEECFWCCKYVPEKTASKYLLLTDQGARPLLRRMRIRPKADRLGAQLADEFAEEISFTTEPTPGMSGYFEVTVGESIVHSKKNGDGYVDSENKLQKIVAAIDKALE